MYWKEYTGEEGPDLIGYVRKQRESSTADVGLFRRKKQNMQKGQHGRKCECDGLRAHKGRERLASRPAAGGNPLLSA